MEIELEIIENTAEQPDESSILWVADENDLYSVTNAAFEGTYTTDKDKIQEVLAERASKLGE